MKLTRRQFAGGMVLLPGIASLGITPALARVEIDINKGNVEPLPIAIPEFVSDDGRAPMSPA